MKNQLNVLRVRSAVLIVAIVAVVSLQACKKENNDWTMDNQRFVTEASSSNSFEIAAGNMAATRSLDTGVISFAQDLVLDHGPTGVELTALAIAKGWTIPTGLLQKHQDDLERLQDADSTDFDRIYADIMVESHEDAVELYADAGHERNGVVDSELKAFATSKLSGLRLHLEAAKELKARLND